MEVSLTTSVFFLLLLATPSSCSSEGGSENGGMGSSSSSEVYEIDYRGPETHSSHIAPPDHSHGRPWIIHRHHPLPRTPADPFQLKGSKVGA